MLVHWSVGHFSRCSFGCTLLPSAWSIMSNHCWWQMPKCGLLARDIFPSRHTVIHEHTYANLCHPSPAPFRTPFPLKHNATHEMWACDFDARLPSVDAELGDANRSPSSSSLCYFDPTYLTFSFHFVPTFASFELRIYFYSLFLTPSLLHSNLYWAVHNHRPSGRRRERWACSSSDDQNTPWVDLHSRACTHTCY